MSAPLLLQWAGATDIGKVRKNNEDTFLGVRFDAQEAHYLGKVGEGTMEAADYVFAVSDGMGGAMAGEFASKITMEKITKLLPRAFGQRAAGLQPDFEDVLPELFDEINKALLYLGESYEECAGMGATLSMGWFTPGWMYFAHIGDSRIYYSPAREGGLRQVTHDDTYVGWLFRQGELNEREAKHHPRRNVLQKALGAGHQFTAPHIGAIACEPGDVFLFCTDGVTDGLYDAALLELLRPSVSGGPDPARRVVGAALQCSGRDNTTALVVELR